MNSKDNNNNNNDNNNNCWTPLPAKWTPSTIVKLHNRLLAKFIPQMLQSKKFTTMEEKSRRIAAAVQWIQLIHNYTMSGQMTYKRKKEKEERRNEMS